MCSVCCTYILGTYYNIKNPLHFLTVLPVNKKQEFFSHFIFFVETGYYVFEAYFVVKINLGRNCFNAQKKRGVKRMITTVPSFLISPILCLILSTSRAFLSYLVRNSNCIFPSIPAPIPGKYELYTFIVIRLSFFVAIALKIRALLEPSTFCWLYLQLYIVHMHTSRRELRVHAFNR